MSTDEKTREEFMLEVGQGHQLYVQDWGNSNVSVPTIYLHGGPGSGTSDSAKSLFDPEQQRVIFFDQRGCGKSVPYGSLEANTTQDIVQDITKIADRLKIEKFNLVGGSWGSCLALVYAVQNPEKVVSMVLRGIFTGMRREIDFLDKGVFKPYFPEIWDQYQLKIAELKKIAGTEELNTLIYSTDTNMRKKYAYAYDYLEGSVANLDDRFKQANYAEFDPVPTLIERHYISNRCFIGESYIHDNSAILTMPIHLVQGRYDSICAAENAYRLDNLLPNSTLIFTVAGHSGQDRANWEATKLLVRELPTKP